MTFRNAEESHEHSRIILDAIQEYDDFMESIESVVDLGCGAGLDLEWWATRTVRDDASQPLNIRCMGVDLADSLPMARRYKNITYQSVDFETSIAIHKSKFDILWSHDSFQYCLNPIQTLSNWRTIASKNASLVISVPTTISFDHNKQQISQSSSEFYHHSLISLIHMLAISGWDCKHGYFLKQVNDSWIHAIVYNSEHTALDPRHTTWHDLVEQNLLPDSADECIKKHGLLRQQDLILPWIDKSLTWYGKQ